ncbi:branched-chain amino acid aminotransferase [Roseomonas sp. USHLN139]|uniref:branched-chain amino acid aminotransferase n=1 Tax=Roseomonas sp. USHLN139 TaxID=3081298 RepID=UPI003B02E78A
MDASVPVCATPPHPGCQPEAIRQAALGDPGFGRHFTDHVALLRYTPDRGWHGGEIAPFAELGLHPAAIVLHYAQVVYEGMEAYALPDGGAALFRPQENARRLQRSAARLAMQPVPEPLFIEALQALVRADRCWIPTGPGAALYLRPFLMGTEATLGLKASSDYLFCVIASPVGNFFGPGAAPLRLWVSESINRAGPGGTGFAKCGGNYGASLPAVAEARREGCDQPVFLDAVERRWVEELGGMNLFFVFADGRLWTPPLSGSILPGVTRDSLLTLARGAGLKVEEAPYSIDEWEGDARSGQLAEAFACGTAAVVAPVGHLRHRGRDLAIGGGREGPVTTRLRAMLEGIQRGTAPDPHGWLSRVL